MNIPAPILVRNIPVCYLVAQLWQDNILVNDEMYRDEGGSPTLEEYCQNYATRADVLEDLGNEITVTEDTTLEALIQDLGTDFAESLQGVEFSANKDYSAETSVQAIESTPIEA